MTTHAQRHCRPPLPSFMPSKGTCETIRKDNHVPPHASLSFATRPQASFAAWLQLEYASSLDALKGSWRSGSAAMVDALTSFEDAAELAAPEGARRGATAEPPQGSGEAARIADWFRFNDFRFRRWQGALARTLWDVSECHSTMAKVCSCTMGRAPSGAHKSAAFALSASRGYLSRLTLAQYSRYEKAERLDRGT